MNCSIPLFSGIGNVIQSLPFIHEMKKRYNRVTAFRSGLDYPDTVSLLDGIVDEIYLQVKRVPKDYKIFKTPRRRSFPESESWFVDNNEPVPNKLEIPKINYRKSHDNVDIVIWPECKENWLCKRWPYWEELVNKLTKNYKIAIVGKEDSPKFSDVLDYRGKLSLLETGGILKSATMFIGNEGGISHYSAAIGTKTYIIMGCTDPIKNLPPNNAIAVTKGLDCQPCQFKNLKQIGITMHGCDTIACLNKLTPDEVMEKISC